MAAKRLAGESNGCVDPPAHHLSAHQLSLLTVNVHSFYFLIEKINQTQYFWFLYL
jgi:hypothetical protein